MSSRSWRSAMPQPGPCVVSAAPEGVRAVKSTFSPSASSPSVARIGIRRVDRNRLAAWVPDAELRREALRIPRLPPEEHVLPTRATARDPAADVRPLLRIRPARPVGALPLVVDRDRPGHETVLLEVLEVPVVVRLRREVLRRAALARCPRALRAPAAEDRLAPPRGPRARARRRRGAARGEVLAVAGQPRVRLGEPRRENHGRRGELSVHLGVPLVGEGEAEPDLCRPVLELRERQLVYGGRDP